MGARSNREIVERYAAALPADWDVLRELRHDQWVEEWPQSGERMVGHDAYRAVHENYPGGIPEATVDRVVGTEDRWTVAPTFTPVRITGEGDTFTMEGHATYPDGSAAYLLTVIEVRDQKVLKQTTYFAAPFEPPVWRAQWVDRMDQTTPR
jgi:hypothetical protein